MSKLICVGGAVGSTSGYQPENGGSNPTPTLHFYTTQHDPIKGKLEIRPTTLRFANDVVADFHRHNGRTARNGGKFALCAWIDETLVGVGIVGNPVSATYMDGFTAEVLRVCVKPGAPDNCCSFLYSACWRAWQAMGGRRLVSYTLKTESGASLRGAGFVLDGTTKPVAPGWRKKDHLNSTRTYSPVMGLAKNRWVKRTGAS